MEQFPSSLDFARAAVPFLQALPRYLRDVPGEPALKNYGSGESGHWAVQINQQVAGALACLAELPPDVLAGVGCAQGADELSALALAMTRYSLRTHVTGDLNCTDGKRWGRHWISVLGYERNFHATGPAALCVPTDRSDMAEWSGNLFAFIGLRGPKHQGSASVEETPGGFRWRWEGEILEDSPLGEGESAYPVLRRVCTAEALPDGRTLRLSDHIECIKETTLPAGFRALHLQIPNDVYNGCRRTYVGEGTSEITIDGALAVRSLSGRTLVVFRPAAQGALTNNGLTSLRIEEVCTAVREESLHLLPGAILCDERYEVEVLP